MHICSDTNQPRRLTQSDPDRLVNSPPRIGRTRIVDRPVRQVKSCRQAPPHTVGQIRLTTQERLPLACPRTPMVITCLVRHRNVRDGLFMLTPSRRPPRWYRQPSHRPGSVTPHQSWLCAWSVSQLLRSNLSIVERAVYSRPMSWER